jgi:sulfatase maturation enzyme AslB (radical SAM superfamily)
MLPTMTTGGRGLTRERAETAAKAGLFSASVSIDGEEATHDESAPPGRKGCADAG